MTPTRLANLGIGHGAIDAGAGYTYLNPQTGHEFSGVLGFTYNFINPSTQYQNGVDMHFDWGASQFLSKQLLVGLVGYAYQELGCDSGSGDRVGCFRSRVFGVGPQLGYIFPLGDKQGYLNIKGYKEFGAEASPGGLERLADLRRFRRRLSRRRRRGDRSSRNNEATFCTPGCASGQARRRCRASSTQAGKAPPSRSRRPTGAPNRACAGKQRSRPAAPAHVCPRHRGRL